MFSPFSSLYRATKDRRHESFKSELARLVAASALDTAKVSVLQFHEVQTS